MKIRATIEGIKSLKQSTNYSYLYHRDLHSKMAYIYIYIYTHKYKMAEHQSFH